MAAARALKAGGVECSEFTMTTPGALETVAGTTREFGDDLLLGAHTREAIERVGIISVQNVLNVLQGKEPLNRVA